MRRSSPFASLAKTPAPARRRIVINIRTRLTILGATAVLVAAVFVVVITTSASPRHHRPASSGAQFAVQMQVAPSTARSPAPHASPSPVSSAPSGSARASATAGRPLPSIGPTASGGTQHFVANVGAAIGTVQALGFNLIDTGPDASTIDALPAGVRALVWLGSLDNDDCAHPGYTFPEFTKAVDGLAGNPRVFGYFLADEPHPKACPTTVADLRQRADYIHAHDASHRSFVVVLDGSNQCGGTYGCEFAAMAPANSHVDLIGVDPYPCNTSNAGAGCTYQKIDDTVRHAEQHGVSANAIVPVYQVFGQACASSTYYRLPSANELREMLAHWAKLVKHPAFDYAYGWEHQDSACPTLSDANGSNGYPDLQTVVREHNLA
jgi:hypothetical protein